MQVNFPQAMLRNSQYLKWLAGKETRRGQREPLHAGGEEGNANRPALGKHPPGAEEC